MAERVDADGAHGLTPQRPATVHDMSLVCYVLVAKWFREWFRTPPTVAHTS